MRRQFLYAYTNSRRLHTRKWTRETSGGDPLTTTYSYGLADGETGDDAGSAIFGDITKVDYNDGTSDITLFHDRLGRLTAVNDATGVRNCDYADDTGGSTDEGDLCIDSETLNGLIDITLDWDRDAFGRQSTFGGAGLTSALYGYDTAGRLTTIIDGTSLETIAHYTYVDDSANLIAAVNLNHGEYQTDNTWLPYRDALDTKVNKADMNGTPVTKSSYDYTVDDAGRRAGVAMVDDAFSGTPTWAWQNNATSEPRRLAGAEIDGRRPPAGQDDREARANQNRLIKVKRASDSALLATYTYDYLGRRVRKVTTGAAPQQTSDPVTGQLLPWRLHAAGRVSSTTPYFCCCVIDEDGRPVQMSP